jgi:proline dehydrogenase
MGFARSLLLAGSQSAWLRRRAPRLPFVRRTVARFMPGEDLPDALAAAAELRTAGITTLLTRLGENIDDAAQADEVAGHYLSVIDKAKERGLDAEISVKLTQLGLDQDKELCYQHVSRLLERAAAAGAGTVWVDMESSEYVDRTLDLYRLLRRAYPNVGVALQAYLRRTASDLEALLPLGPSIRLVKGAYREPPDRAFPRKRDVDENYFRLARMMVGEPARRAGAFAAFGTHDVALIERLRGHLREAAVPRDAFEFEMLYGIQRAEQRRLAAEGERMRVLISYGDYWFPWFMRRLAERPANVWFVARSLFGG